MTGMSERAAVPGDDAGERSHSRPRRHLRAVRVDAERAATALVDDAAFMAEAAALYRRHQRQLEGWVGRRVSGPPALVEDACAQAWLALIRSRPVLGERIFAWLCTAALREAYELSRVARRQPAIDPVEGRPAFVPAGRDDPETAVAAREALRAVAALPGRQRRYLAWQLAGHSYQEMRALAGGATYTNVNKQLVRARGRLRAHAETRRDPASAAFEVLEPQQPAAAERAVQPAGRRMAA
jgi:DNA-directed RNA polymerase specialized sigma24 family protein